MAFPPNLVGQPEHFPRMPGQQSEVAPASPLAVVALIAEIARQRFRDGNQLPWVWDDNPTDPSTETNEVGEPKKIIIEPTFSINDEIRNYRPAIFVDKGETVGGKVAINNFVGQQLKSGFKGFYAMGTIPFDLEILGESFAESAQIADIIWFYFLANREQVRATFGIHDVTNPTLGRTLPSKTDKVTFSTHVTFDIQVEFRWTTLPISPLLQSIVAKYKQSGCAHPDEYLLKQYVGR